MAGLGSKLVEAQAVSLQIAGRTLLEDIQLSLTAGQFTILLGPNGAGKSSLLRLLCGEWQPSSGSILFGGLALNSWQSMALAKRRAVLSQSNQLTFPFTVREVVALGRLPYSQGRPSTKEKELIAQQLEVFDLTQIADRRFTKLSGGEKQRTHLARVTVQLAGGTPNQPTALFLDEPTNNLDPVHHFALLEYAREFAQQGHLIVCVLHDLNTAMRYADNAIMMHEGRIHAAGKPEAILNEANIRSVLGVDAKFMRSEDDNRILVDMLGKASQPEDNS